MRKNNKKGKLMNRTKRMVSLVLIMAVLASMAVTAMAAGTNSIEVTGVKKGEIYSAYKMLDLKVNSDFSAYTYTVNEAWESFFGKDEVKDYVTVSTDGVVIWNDGKDTEADMTVFAKAAAEFAENLSETGEITAPADGNITFTGLEPGYYLITSTLGTKAMIETTPDNPSASVGEKNPEDTIIKEVKEDSTGKYGENNDAQVGDTVEFKSTATLRPNTRNVVVHDKMDAGLTFTSGSVVVEGLTPGKHYTVNESPKDNDTFDIIFTEKYLNSLTADTTLTITYKAILNENAIVKTEDAENGEGGTIAIVGQNNTTKITYGDKQSAEDATTTTTHKFSVYKHAEGKTEYLAGATFSLKKNGTVVKLIRIDDNNYRVANGNEDGAVETFTTNTNGDIVIWGVDSDTDYTLKETAAPSGYNMLTAEVAVTVEAGNATRADITNSTGVKLPTTGGMGTKMFYIVGMMLMTGSAVMLITKKRMKAE